MLKKDIVFKMVEDQVKLDNICWERAKLITPPVRNVKLALYVELGELANELNDWKYWKQNKRLNIENIREELADCIHFALSNLYLKKNRDWATIKDLLDSMCGALTHIDYSVFSVLDLLEYCYLSMGVDKYDRVLKWLFTIGFLTGMSFDDVVDCYYEKYEINLERQAKNY